MAQIYDYQDAYLKPPKIPQQVTQPIYAQPTLPTLPTLPTVQSPTTSEYDMRLAALNKANKATQGIYNDQLKTEASQLGLMRNRLYNDSQVGLTGQSERLAAMGLGGNMYSNPISGYQENANIQLTNQRNQNLATADNESAARANAIRLAQAQAAQAAAAQKAQLAQSYTSQVAQGRMTTNDNEKITAAYNDLKAAPNSTLWFAQNSKYLTNAEQNALNSKFLSLKSKEDSIYNRNPGEIASYY